MITLYYKLHLPRDNNPLRTHFQYIVFMITAIMAAPVVALSDDTSPLSKDPTPGTEAAPPQVANLPSVAEARRQAEVLHTAIHSVLQTVHHNFYREDEGLPLPASVMQDVFTELEQAEQVKLRWLAVEGQAMNTDHIAQDDFERQAVAALKSGEKSFERVETGNFRRAAAITLSNHCLKCHVPDRKSTANRTAGLIISIPIREN